VFGLDNVLLSLFDTGSLKLGDFYEDGVLDDADLDTLTAQILGPTPDTRYDLDADGSVDDGDLSIWMTMSFRQDCVK